MCLLQIMMRIAFPMRSNLPAYVKDKLMKSVRKGEFVPVS